jgi:hypothetical protein
LEAVLVRNEEEEEEAGEEKAEKAEAAERGSKHHTTQGDAGKHRHTGSPAQKLP